VSWHWRSVLVRKHKLEIFAGELLGERGVHSDHLPVRGSEAELPPHYVGFAMLWAWTGAAVAVSLPLSD
jgi:hypothetical protein